MASWATRKHQHAENFNLSDSCTVSKDLVEYLADFQLNTIRFLWKNYKEIQGCILSGESGMGKISTILAFFSAIYANFKTPQEKILVVCKNHMGTNHWKYQMKEFLPISSSLSPDDIIFITMDFLEDDELLSSKIYHYVVIDARYSTNLTDGEIKKLKRIQCKRRLLVTCNDLMENVEELKNLLHCIDSKWVELLGRTNDRLLIITTIQKFILRQQKNQYNDQFPLRQEDLYHQGFAEWQKSTCAIEKSTPNILSEESENLRGLSFGNHFRGKFFSDSSADSGTPELIFSDEEFVKTSSRIIPRLSNATSSSSKRDEDDVIPASPDESQPIFRRRCLRRRILSSTQNSTEVTDTNENRKLTSGCITPNLFESSEESEAEKEMSPKDTSVLNTSTPLSNESPKHFLISQSPIETISKHPPPQSVNFSHDGSEVFEITTNPTFSHQIRISSKRDVSPLPTSPPQSPKTPESASVPRTDPKWRKTTEKAEQDKCETPRSRAKSSGWLSKISPKRSQHQRLTPRNLSITFEVQKREAEALKKSFERPIPTQEPEEGFPRKRRCLKDFLNALSDDEDF